MAKTNRNGIEYEEMLDGCERLLIMGVRKPHAVATILGITDMRTAEKYIQVAQRRLSRRNRTLDKDQLLKEQLDLIDQAIFEHWRILRESTGQQYEIAALKGLAVVMKQKAELLGLEAPKEIAVGGNKGETLLELLTKLPHEQAKAIIDQLEAARTE